MPRPPVATSPAIDAVLTTWPGSFCAIMRGRNTSRPWITPQRFTASAHCQSRWVAASSPPQSATPALLQRTCRRAHALRAGHRRPSRQPRVPLGRDRRARLPSSPAPRGGLRSAADDGGAGRARAGEPQEDARGRGRVAHGPRLGDALPHRRGGAGRFEPRVGALPRRPPADDDDRRGESPRDPPALQARDQRDRGHRRTLVTATLGFVGLGVMGGRMAKRLLDARHPVVGYNRTRAKAQWLADAGLRLAASPREVAQAADVVFTMVTDTAALEAVTRGPDGILAGLRRGGVLIEMSTVSPEAIRALAADVAARGAELLDAPVSRSPATLEARQLSFMVGGAEAGLERVRPYLTAIGPTITHVGALGLAKAMKLAINQGLAVQMLAFAEAVVLAEKAGVARERAVEAVLRSVVASPMLK